MWLRGPPNLGVAHVSEIVRKPTQFSARLAVATAAVAALLAALGGGIGAALGLVGLVLLAGGLYDGRQSVSDLGALALLFGIVAAGMAGAAPTVALLAAVAVVLAWDFATTAHTMGEELGREADTRRAEAMHAAGSTGVGVLVVGGTVLVRGVASGGQPTGALMLMLIAAMVLVLVLRE